MSRLLDLAQEPWVKFIAYGVFAIALGGVAHMFVSGRGAVLLILGTVLVTMGLGLWLHSRFSDTR